MSRPKRRQRKDAQERLKHEVERLRRELAECDRQIAEQAKQIAKAEKQIVDLETSIGSATAKLDDHWPVWPATHRLDFNLSEMPDAARRRQNATFRDPETTRGVEYCPCTIVLSFDSK